MHFSSLALVAPLSSRRSFSSAFLGSARPPSTPRGESALSLHAPIPTPKDHGRRFTLSRLTPSCVLYRACSFYVDTTLSPPPPRCPISFRRPRLAPHAPSPLSSRPPLSPRAVLFSPLISLHPLHVPLATSGPTNGVLGRLCASGVAIREGRTARGLVGREES